MSLVLVRLNLNLKSLASFAGQQRDRAESLAGEVRRLRSEKAAADAGLAEPSAVGSEAAKASCVDGEPEQFESLRRDVVALEAERDEAKEAVRELQMLLRSKNAQLERLKLSEMELRDVGQRGEQLNERLRSQLQTQIELVKELEKRVEKQKASLRVDDDVVVAFQSELQAAQSQHGELRACSERQQEALVAQQRTIDSLMSSIKQARDAKLRAEADTEDERARVGRLESQLSQRDARIRELEAQIASMQAERVEQLREFQKSQELFVSFRKQLLANNTTPAIDKCTQTSSASAE